MNHIVSGYIDDLYLQGSTYQNCALTIIDSIQILDRLRLVTHPEKSELIPQQNIVFFGFVIDSVKMIVTVTDNKIHKIKELLTFRIHNAILVRIREVARLIGYLVSSLPAVKYGALHYRYLEMDKIKALKHSKGDFEATMAI